MGGNNYEEEFEMTSDLTSEMDCSALEPQHSVQIWTKSGQGREESIHILTNARERGQTTAEPCSVALVEELWELLALSGRVDLGWGS